MSATPTISLSFFTSSAPENKFMQAAQDKLEVLSHAIHSAFSSVTKPILHEIKPVFMAAVNDLRAMMDKMSSKAREGQMPWAKPGIGNDAENALLQRRRKNWRERFLPGWCLQKS